MMERVGGNAPPSSVWKTVALLLSYTRKGEYMARPKQRLNAVPRRLLCALILAGPRGLNIHQITDAVYGDREDGGPAWSSSVLYANKRAVNRVLPHGMRIATVGRTQSARHVLVAES